MPDLRFPVDDTMFALRAGLLCVQEGHLLVLGGETLGFCSLPGGAVRFGETPEAAAAREWREELCHLELGHLEGVGPCGPFTAAGLIENFFELNGRAWHELGVYFRLTDPPPRWEGRRPGDQPGEWLEWVPLEELSAVNLQPAALKHLLPQLLHSLGSGFGHIVNRERPAQVGRDLHLREHGWRFQVRAHLLYEQSGRVLTNTVPGSGFWFLPGGSVRLDEDSEQAARREWREETGSVPSAARLVGLCSGFDWAGQRQQFGLIYRITVGNDGAGSNGADGDWTAPPTVRDEPGLALEWVPRSELETRPVHPHGLSTLLDLPPGVVLTLFEEWGAD